MILIILSIICIALAAIVLYLIWPRFNSLIRKKIQWYKSLLGIKKKAFSISILLIFVIGILLSDYSNWRKEYINDISASLTSGYEKTDKSISFDEYSKKLLTKEIGIFSSKKSRKLYLNERGGFMSFFGIVVTLILLFLSFYKFSSYEIFSLLHIRSKDRIKILDKFSSNEDLIGNKSIYNSFIDVIQRCESLDSPNSKLKLLLCSPLVDYPERTNGIDGWGEEFSRLLEHIAHSSSDNIDLSVWHLPNRIINGSNPLKSFTEVLANSITPDKQNASENFNKIWNKTINRLSDFKILNDDKSRKFQINRTVVNDIPFQIILHRSKELNEVVVSFAGRKLLEDETTNDFYGFHSVDLDVVEAFEAIFDSYVKEKRRTPIKPQHSLNIIAEIQKNTEPHIIENYLESSAYKNMIDEFKLSKTDIEVPPQTFSPAYANSSKFTSIVLKTIIGKEDKVLEIGAGTGVQSIVAYKTQVALGNINPVVYALEMDEKGFTALQNNLNINAINFDSTTNIGVKPINATLKAVNGTNISFETNDSKLNKEVLANGKLEIIKNDAFPKNQEHFDDLISSPINFLIADLPYVDTEAEEGLERAFYDLGHYAHQALFFYFNNNPQFDNNARLLTSFSSLGGEEDLIRFELMIRETGLFISHKQSFFEDGYEWIVYTIVKTKQDGYWQEYLNCKI